MEVLGFGVAVSWPGSPDQRPAGGGDGEHEGDGDGGEGDAGTVEEGRTGVGVCEHELMFETTVADSSPSKFIPLGMPWYWEDRVAPGLSLSWDTLKHWAISFSSATQIKGVSS